MPDPATPVSGSTTVPVDLDARRAQIARAGAASNHTRGQVADLRRGLRTGTIELADVLLHPPAYIAHMALVDVVDLQASTRAAVRRANLGRDAVRAGVNLLQPVGRASLASRTWTVENVRPPVRRRTAA